MPYPYVIKPNDNGSSVGVAIITKKKMASTQNVLALFKLFNLLII